MAENTVVKEQLTDAMIEGGAALTGKLDEAGIRISAAFWFFDPELNEWRLLFASPDVNTKGPRDIYAKIRKALDELGELASAVPLSLIKLLDSEADLVRLIRIAAGTGPDLVISRIRFSKNVIGGRFIDDALIYRAA